MMYTTVASSEWAYPDIWEYESAAPSPALYTARNAMPSVQVLLRGAGEKPSVSARATGKLANLTLEAFEMVPIFVEETVGLAQTEGKNRLRGVPSRFAPFYAYDCIKPLKDACTPKDGTVGLYFCFPIPKDAAPGLYAGALEITVDGKKIAVPLSVEVFPATIPDQEHLKIVNEFVEHTVWARHGLKEGSPESHQMFMRYMKLARRMKQNTTRASLRPARMVQKGDGSVDFDFTDMILDIEELSAMGYTHFTVFLGHRSSWQESTILVFGVPSMSYEGYALLANYLPKLNEIIVEKGWQGRIILSVSDEPNEKNATEYRALAGLTRKLAPAVKLHDAVSYVPIHGALDIWVPLNSEYQLHQREFESFRGKGDEIWHYTCCAPRYDGYINRFIDYPLLATRYLLWGNYKYNLSGFLHWGGNYYQPGQDPFTCSCPCHTNADANARMPAGDTHIVYPGEDGPLSSMRLEAHRLSVEDYELLLMLSQKDKAKADAICGTCFRSFNDVSYDTKAFESARVALLRAVSAL